VTNHPQGLDTTTNRSRGRNTLVNYSGADANVDSDCEGDSMGAGDGAPKMKEEGKELARAVFTIGSFSAYVHLPSCLHLKRNDEFFSWKSLFFYRCTDSISFAPLKSQGVESRLDYIRARSATTAPPPCSPKTIYILASLVGKPLIKCLVHDTDGSIEARNTAPLRYCIRRHQEQTVFR